MPKQCSIEGCTEPVKSRGMCNVHYRRWLRTGDPTKVKFVRHEPRLPCRVPGCPELARRWGYCDMHAQRFRKYGDPLCVKKVQRPRAYPPGQMPETCIDPGCDKPATNAGRCWRHYMQQYRWGSQRLSPKQLETCPVCRERQYQPWRGYGMCCECREPARARGNRPRMKVENGFWTRETCLAAGHEWVRRTGYAPRTTDWRGGGSQGRLMPENSDVYKWFDSWDEFVSALGATIRPRKERTGQRFFIPSEACIQAGLGFIDIYGYLPSTPQWEAALMHPSRELIRKRFGQWDAFLDALSERMYDEEVRDRVA